MGGGWDACDIGWDGLPGCVPEDDFDADAEMARWVADLEAGRERIPPPVTMVLATDEGSGASSAKPPGTLTAGWAIDHPEIGVPARIGRRCAMNGWLTLAPCASRCCIRR